MKRFVVVLWAAKMEREKCIIHSRAFLISFSPSPRDYFVWGKGQGMRAYPRSPTLILHLIFMG